MQIQGTPQNAHEEKSRMLAERISELVEQAERLGCEGKVEEAQGVLKLCDQLREERMNLQEVCFVFCSRLFLESSLGLITRHQFSITRAHH